MIKPSHEMQNPVSLYFEVPKDFDHKGKTELDLHILVPKNDEGDDEPVRNKELKIRVRADYKGNMQNIGGWFDESVTESIKIEEPLTNQDGKRLRHYRITFKLNSKHVDPQDLAILVIDRENSTSTKARVRDSKEYAKNIYIVGASFRYTKKGAK